MPTISTRRCVLREWIDSDREPFAALNADPRVMEFFPAPLTPTQSATFLEKNSAHIAGHGFGLWAVEVPGVTAFAGTVGLLVPGFNAPFTPCIEMSWRFGFDAWGNGYACETALAVLSFGFHNLNLPEIVSFTAYRNHRSRRLMERIGMEYSRSEDFHHPNLPPEHHLSLHALYRLKRQNFRPEGLSQKMEKRK